MNLQYPLSIVSHLLIRQRLVSMLPELTSSVQPEECVSQPPVRGKGLFKALELGVFLPELLLERLEGSQPLLAVGDQETAELFTSLATSASTAAW